jgi:hypothetical protein
MYAERNNSVASAHLFLRKSEITKFMKTLSCVCAIHRVHLVLETGFSPTFSDLFRDAGTNGCRSLIQSVCYSCSIWSTSERVTPGEVKLPKIEFCPSPFSAYRVFLYGWTGINEEANGFIWAMLTGNAPPATQSRSKKKKELNGKSLTLTNANDKN